MQAQTDVEVSPGRRYIIRRPRLTRMLDATEAQVIALIAPAGYGKTTLALEWLEGRGLPYAWCRGSPAIADVAALALGIAHASDPLAPGAADRMQKRLRAANSPEHEVRSLAELLADDLVRWPEDAWITIDDYHFASESDTAEHFVDLLLGLAPIRLLLTSRIRPRWATPRRMLYGEIFEVDSAALAMTAAEVDEVFDRAGAAVDRSDLTRLGGWPAIIGLAAIRRDTATHDGRTRDDLFDYFADELYRAAPEHLKRDLFALAHLPAITRDLASEIFERDALTSLREAERLGFVQRVQDDVYHVHPLVRAFLAARAAELDERAVDRAVQKVVGALVHHAQWDEAFAVAEQLSNEQIFVDLVDRAMTKMFASGRVTTIRQWLNYADQHHFASPILTLAHAELERRSGSYPEAEAHALDGLRQPGADPDTAFRLHLVAGEAAHLASDDERAAKYHRKAIELAPSELGGGKLSGDISSV